MSIGPVLVGNKMESFIFVYAQIKGVFQHFKVATFIDWYCTASQLSHKINLVPLLLQNLGWNEWRS